MKTLRLLVTVLALAVFLLSYSTYAKTDVSQKAATGEQIKWQVISGGATNGTSTSFILMGTVGQTAAGPATSTSYGLNSGFWQDFGGGGCCVGIRGNFDGDLGDNIDIADLLFMVDYQFGNPAGPAPPCFEEGDYDASLGIDIGDLLAMVDYQFGNPAGPAPVACP